MVFSGGTMSYKDKYEHAMDRFTAVCKDMFEELEQLKRENVILKGSNKCATREVQKYRIALETIERHRNSTFWPQNETVESMAECAKNTLIEMGAWD